MADATVRATYQTFGRPGIFTYSSPNGGVVKILQVFVAEAVNGGVTVDSIAPAPAPATPSGVQITDYRNFGLWVKCAGGSPDITVKLLESWDDVAADYAVPETSGSLITITDTSPHVVVVTPVLMPWLRLRVVGNVGNGSDTTVTANFVMAAEA